MSSSDQVASLRTVDYVVFGAMFVFTMAIGIWKAFRGDGARSRESYFVGNRKMHYLPVALSMVVTYESSIMMLGLPTEAYVYGTATAVIAFGQLFGTLLANVVAVPLFKPLNITSSFELIQLRFNSRSLRVCGVILTICSYLFYAGIVLYAQAVALETVMGLNMWLSILVMDACAIFYTSLGGIKSVVWTDVFQSVIMFGGIIAIIIKGTLEVGGTSRVWEIASEGKRLDMFDFNPDPTIRHSVWCAFLPSIISSGRFWYSQPTVQRILASRSIREARYMVSISAAGYLIVYLLVMYEGLVVYAFFSQRDDEPISCGLIKNPNQIIPYTVLILFEKLPGMAGLFLAALYSASLSTVSSILSGLSILVTEDLLESRLKSTSDKRATVYAKISVVFLGIITLIFCCIVSFIEGPFTQITNSVISSTNGPTVGIFYLATFFPSTHSKGVYIGILIGIIMGSILTLGGNFSGDVKKTPFLPLGNNSCLFPNDVTGSNLSDVFVYNETSVTASLLNVSSSVAPNVEESYNIFFSISYILFSPIGIMTTIVVGVIASYLIGRNKPGDVNPKYLRPISDTFLILLPPPIRRWLKGLGPQFEDGWKETKAHTDEELETLPVA